MSATILPEKTFHYPVLLNEVINISGGKTNSNVTNDHQENWSGYNAGVSLTKEVKGVDFDLNFTFNRPEKNMKQPLILRKLKSCLKYHESNLRSTCPIPLCLFHHPRR